MNKRKPVHPGEVLLEDIINPLHLTITAAAQLLGISRKTLSEVIHGKCSITPEMAMRLSVATNTSAESWLNMQAKLDLWVVAHTKKFEVKKFPAEQIA